jgi:hypothetical protein
MPLFNVIPLLLIFLALCAGCGKHRKNEIPFSLQQICGRDEIISYGQQVRRPLYQVKVPLEWIRIDPSENDSLLDTKKPLVTFIIHDQIRLVVHNFPTQSLEERILPAAQIERWASQLKGGSWRTERCGHDGFFGFYFEGDVENKKVCAWSLQLDAELYQTLHFLAATVEEEEHFRQMAADYTIKLAGPSELIEKQREQIALFVSSFHLIQEIPPKL